MLNTVSYLEFLVIGEDGGGEIYLGCASFLDPGSISAYVGH